jgi:hypothetical protein
MTNARAAVSQALLKVAWKLLQVVGNKLFLLRNWRVEENLNVPVAAVPVKRIELRPLVSQNFAVPKRFLSYLRFLVICVAWIPLWWFNRALFFRKLFDLHGGHKLSGLAAICRSAHCATAKTQPWPAVFLLHQQPSD